ncbi:Translation elongation/initiation factor/Ribosomal beta-barrel [Penicillium cosmopolitanum]|uniref:Translation elongation/initiation factor/Ribosomal beta-barrel n=1 Tax=Penicillium cosmopolitanum TaxID=1131564 RepID=A0A9W9W2A8_9EURO|nr:Translation elongation/initiation factor/Ribosomal beta-barrel [Penicillium cosmopolitanum]KAJ5397370.1 Translation elongation/initiation factor/Ribosomal beta-barrel [Penicillium cosmopolitanum]
MLSGCLLIRPKTFHANPIGTFKSDPINFTTHNHVATSSREAPAAFLLREGTGAITAPLIPIRGFGIRSLNEPKPNRFNVGANLPVLESSTTAALLRKANSLPLRTGAIATKKGMTAIFDPESGKRTACTVLQLDRVEVVSHKTRQKHGYYAVQVGAGWKHPSNMTKSLLGHFAANGLSPKRHVYEFRVKSEEGLLPVGESIYANWFQEGQFIDTKSNTKGSFSRCEFETSFYGFVGSWSGWWFSCLPGKKMAGNMGNTQNTVQNLRILKVDRDTGVVVVSGHVSGPKGCVVRIQDAVKKPWPEVAPAAEAEAVTV